jgi:hypothetical protein
MISYKHKHALCFKDGFMISGSQFCVKDKIYEYIITKNTSVSHRYTVKTETCSTHNHSMTDDFFKKYFLPDWVSPKTIPLEEDLFEI